MADETLQPESPGDAAARRDEEARLLGVARQLLERGEYGQVLRLLEPLTGRHAAATAFGAELRLMLATALIGQGRSEEASRSCKGLQACPDPELRAKARDLQQILAAPALERPRDWSLDLPPLQGGASLEALGGGQRASRRRRPAPPPPPPVGSTRPPLGFAALAGLLLLLVLLASLLGGCVEVRTDLRFSGPGRLQVSHEVRSLSGQPGPWQNALPALLAPEGFRSRRIAGSTRLEAPVLPADAALARLSESFRLAAALADLPLPPPRIDFHERNWLLGVRQRLAIAVDLRELPALPALALSLELEPFAPSALLQAAPLVPESLDGQRLRWRLQPGSLNTLALQSWRWSPLGLGACGIALLLPLVLALQRLRRELGFGLPELPP